MFMVDSDGTIQNAQISKGIGGGCDESALNLVKTMPKWIPGKKDGQNVKAFFTIQVGFKLVG